MKQFLSVLKLQVQYFYKTWLSQHANWILKSTTIIVLILFCISILFLIFKWGRLPQEIPLWYSRPWGEDQLAHPAWLLLFPMASLAWYFFNAILGATVSRDNLIFLQSLYLTSLLLSILSCIALVKIVSLVT